MTTNAEALAADADHLAKWLLRRGDTTNAAACRSFATELRRLSAVEAERDALKADAERWRAARLLARHQQIDGEHRILLGNLPWPHTGHATTPDYADAAIDAAMQGESTP